MKNIDEFELLTETYHNMIYSIINKYYVQKTAIVLQEEDLYQEALIALYEARQKFDESLNVSFTTFAYTLIDRRILRIIKKHNKCASHEHIAYDHFENPDHLSFSAMETTKQDHKLVYLKSLLNSNLHRLNLFEQQLLNAYLDNKSYQEISLELNVNKKKVDNTLIKIKKLFKKIHQQNIGY